MSEIDLSEIQNKDENDFIELNEEKTNKPEIKPKRKYKKGNLKLKKKLIYFRAKASRLTNLKQIMK